MNILVIAPYGMYDNISGSFVHNQVKEYVKLGHRVRVVLPIAYGKKITVLKKINPGVSYTQIEGVEIYYVKYFSLSKFGVKRFNLLSTQLSIKAFMGEFLDDFCSDVVHAHSIEYGGTLGKIIKAKYNIPLIITTHGSDTESALRQENREKARMICESADLIVAVSEKLKRKLEQLEIKTPILRIFNGYSINNIVKSEKDSCLITQVGHLIPSKHFEDTITAVSILKEKNIIVKLNIIGKGKLLSKLKDLCNKLNITDQVEFFGEIENKLVFEKLAKSRFFVLPSFPEGFGIVYLEAMASECIAIGTEGEGIADIIVSGENGYLVAKESPKDIADIIEYYIDNPKEAEKIGCKAMECVFKLSWAENARNYIKMFQKLILKE